MRDVLILGSGRSGTSMVAGCLASAGYFMGEQLYPARESNPKGFFEDPEINGVNELLLAPVIGPEQGLGKYQRWLARVPLDVQLSCPDLLGRGIRRLVTRRPFCFKDPRLCYTLPAWRPWLPADVACVCVFRDPATTVASILKECRDADYLRGVPIDADRAFETWTLMYRHVLERHRQEGDWLFLHYDEVLEGPGLERLAHHTGADVDRSFPEKQFRRSRGEREVPAAARRVYEKLRALAQEDAGEEAPSRVVEPVAPQVVAPEAPVRPVPRPVVGLDAGRGPHLSVIVCTYERPRELGACLESFARQDVASASYEVIVVDDGESDRSRRVVDGLSCPPDLRYLQRPRGSLASARNAALHEARGEVLLLVNDDTIAGPSLVREHLAAHAQHSGDRVSVLGTFEQPTRALGNALMRLLECSELVFAYNAMQPGQSYDWTRFWTCNVSVTREALEEVGEFDERFGIYGCEDTDLGVRLHRCGYRVLFHGQARAWHHHVLDFDALERRQRTVARAYVRFFAKHPDLMAHPSWRWIAQLTRSDLRGMLEQRFEARRHWESAGRELARVDLAAFEGVSGASAQLAAQVVERLRDVLVPLNELWWQEGVLAGLEEMGLDGLRDLIGTAEFAASGARSRIPM